MRPPCSISIFLFPCFFVGDGIVMTRVDTAMTHGVDTATTHGVDTAMTHRDNSIMANSP